MDVGGNGEGTEAVYSKGTVEGEGRGKMDYVKIATHTEGEGVDTGVCLDDALELEAPEMGGDGSRIVGVKVASCEGGDGGGLIREYGGVVCKGSCKC